MKLFDILSGKKKTEKTIGQKTPPVPPRHPAVKKANPTGQVQPLPKKQPDPTRSVLRPQDFSASEPVVFRDQRCQDDHHDFAGPYPLTCRKCGLPLSWNEQQLSKYMGSYIENVSYQWTRFMDHNDIVSFSVSAGNRPIFEASCDFAHLRIRNCLNGSRDGWMQSHYPQGYFEPLEIKLNSRDIQTLRTFFASCDWSAWTTPVHYVENHDAPGFSVSKRLRCTFANGKQFVCLDPDNSEFERLVSMLREMARSNGKKEDQEIIQRILDDTDRKEKHIYWLISQSLEEKRMELIAQGAPFFNYQVAREMRYGDNANAELMVHVIRFSNGSAWVTETGVPENEYCWESLPQDTGNDLGAAFDLLHRHFESLPEPGRKLFPIVAVVLDGPITDDWLAAQARFQQLPGVNKHVLTIAVVMGNKVEKQFLKKFDGVIYQINSMEDIINEMDSPLFAL